MEEIKVNENNKVWLIMAQGQNSMYLMPVVRNSGHCGWGDTEKKEKNISESEAEIRGKGVGDINKWSNNFDKGGKLGKEQVTKLKRLMGSGFSITRKIIAANWNERAEGWNRNMEVWAERAGAEEWWKEYGPMIKKEFQRGEWNLYKNAGELTFEGGWNDDSHYCYRKERYFPLDLVILNGSKGRAEPTVTYASEKQTIKITDTISEVIGVRLDLAIKN